MKTNDKEFPWFLGEQGIEAYIRKVSYVVLDFETTNLQYGTASNPANRLVMGCWRVVKGGLSVDKFIFGDEYNFQELLDDIASTEFLVAHNAQFELSWLSRCGLDLRSVLCYCTLVGEWVINGNRRTGLSLEDCADRYKLGRKGSLVSSLLTKGVCPSTMPRSWLLSYCRVDVDLCHKVFLKQHEQLSNLDLWHIALSRNLAIPVLSDIHMAGLELDKEAVLEEEIRLQFVLETLGEKLDRITGGINLGSPKQLGELLYKKLGFAPPRDQKGNVIKTPTGRLPTNEDIINVLVPISAVQSDFLVLYKEYNRASTLLTKNVAFFKQVCLDPALKGKYNSLIVHGRTMTHRLASSGIGYFFKVMKNSKQVLSEMKVQAQNLPRQYKKFFISHDPDYEILEADGAGMEFRAAIIIGKDAAGKEDVISGADIHATTRDTMNAAYAKLDMEIELSRQDAKSSTFAPLYGGNGKDEAEREYVKFFRDKYKGISRAQSNWTTTVAERKVLELPWGMRFYWPKAKVHQSGYVSFTTEIYNFPVQNLATAEIIPVALVHFWHRIEGLPITIFNTVHDSIVSRVHKDYMDVAKELSKIAMTTDVYKFFEEVYRYKLWDELPLGVGLKSGKAWGVSDEEFVYDVWQSGRERLTVERNKKKELVYDTVD